MKTSSCKAKGRRCGKELQKAILSVFKNLTENDVRVTPSGVPGPDIQLSEIALKDLPIDFECKNVESLNIWACLKQVEERCGAKLPVLVFKRNRSKCYVALDMETFLHIYKGYIG